MRVVIISCLAFFCLLLSISTVHAQNRFIPFSYNDSLSIAHKSVDGKERMYLDVNKQLFAASVVSVGDVLLFEHDEVEFEFTVKKVVSYRPDTYTYVANSGLNYFYFTVGSDAAIGAIHLADMQYEAVVVYDSALKASYLQVHDHDEELGCGIHQIHDHILDQSGDHTDRIGVTGNVDLDGSTQSVEEETTVKLLIAYANGAQSWMQTYGGVDNVINQAMALAQEALDVSDTKVILDLVHVTHVQHNESGIGGSVLLNQLRNTSDGIMDEVHSLRNIFEADIVSLLAFINDVGGVGYLPSSPDGDDRLGFNVNRVQQVGNTYVMIHEIGHNFGNMHSRNQASNAAGFNGGVFPYSTGWRWIGDDNVSYASVMTYENSPLDGVNSIRTPHFSNPSISYRGVPTGTSNVAERFGPADNARSMREMRDVIAAYRPRSLTNDQLEVSSVNPAWGSRGSNVIVVFRGRNFNNISNISWLCPNNGAMQATSATINSPSQMTVSWNISFSAAPGVCEIRLWTGAVNSSASVSAQFNITDFPIETPTVLTMTVSNVDQSSAVIGGSISYDGGAPVTDRGVCLATTPNPTVDDICLTAGTGEGDYMAEFFGLTPATLFNVRAFAVNLAGIAYGQQVSFTTADPILNMVPTINVLSDVTITALGAFELEIPLSGISYGDDETEQELSVSAVSSDPDLFDIEIEYASPDSIGLLRLSGDGTRFGTATISVLVRDGGGTSFGGVDSVVVQFVAEVVMGTSIDPDVAIATEFMLHQNYPNPFNPSTQVSFSLPFASHVDLAVYDVMGRRVMKLMDGNAPAGSHTVTIDAKSLPSGVYMYVIRAGEYFASRKMTLIK